MDHIKVNELFRSVGVKARYQPLSPNDAQRVAEILGVPAASRGTKGNAVNAAVAIVKAPDGFQKVSNLSESDLVELRQLMQLDVVVTPAPAVVAAATGATPAPAPVARRRSNSTWWAVFGTIGVIVLCIAVMFVGSVVATRVFSGYVANAANEPSAQTPALQNEPEIGIKPKGEIVIKEEDSTGAEGSSAEVTSDAELTANDRLSFEITLPGGEKVTEKAHETWDPNVYGAIANVREDTSFPAYLDMRSAIDRPGGYGWSALHFLVDVPDLTILRTVCDDRCIGVVLHTPDGSKSILDLFQMVMVNSDTTLPEEVLQTMETRGMESRDQVLAQNTYAVHLGKVPAGSWIEVLYQDDSALQVNKGPFVALSTDTDPYTKNLDGSWVQSPTYWPESLKEIDLAALRDLIDSPNE